MVFVHIETYLVIQTITSPHYFSFALLRLAVNRDLYLYIEIIEFLYFSLKNSFFIKADASDYPVIGNQKGKSDFFAPKRLMLARVQNLQFCHRIIDRISVFLGVQHEKLTIFCFIKLRFEFIESFQLG